MTVDPELLYFGYHPNEENAIGELDYSPETNPCGGWPGTDANPGHDTAVASVLGGNTTGVAKNVTIVPVKTSTLR